MLTVAGLRPRAELGRLDVDLGTREVADLDLAVDLRLDKGQDGLVERLRDCEMKVQKKRSASPSLGWAERGGYSAGALLTLDEAPVGKVYKITHRRSGISYVGLTIQALMNRWWGHTAPSSLEKEKCVLLARAIKKYGKEAFRIDIIEDGIPLSQLADRERALIASHRTLHPNGYNVNPGGEMSPMLNPETRAKSKASNMKPAVRAQRSASCKAAKPGKWLRKCWQDPKYQEMMRDARVAGWAAKREAKLAKLPPEEARRKRRKAETNKALRERKRTLASSASKATSGKGQYESSDEE